MSKLKKVWAADFETSYDENGSWVYLGCLVNCESGQIYNFYSIDEFISLVDKLQKKISKIYFHNLKFDGTFICDYFLRNNIKFDTIIDNLGSWYMILYNKIKIIDSLKLIPLKISQFGKCFGLEDKEKLHYEDYHKPRDYEVQPYDIEYCNQDTIILMEGLRVFYERGFDKMTIGSNALEFYKNILAEKYGKNSFRKFFPILPKNIDSIIRDSYKGGYCYVCEDYKDKEIQEGIVYDVNSMYPGVMVREQLPYGWGRYKELNGEEPSKYIDKCEKLWIANIDIQFKLRDGFIPTIQLKNNAHFLDNEYIKDSKCELINMTITSVDYEMIQKHYIIENIEWNYCVYFKASNNLFKDYYEYWNNEKIEGAKEKNAGKRQIAKLFMNNLYGKFGSNPDRMNKQLIYDNHIRFETKKGDDAEIIYTAVATFTTAYARKQIITAAQIAHQKGRFVYCDTDSLHLVGCDILSEIWRDDFALGAYKLEEKFDKAKYLRQKTYIHETDKKLTIKCAGMPDAAKATISDIKDFKIGNEYEGKLTQKILPGGAALIPSTFKIKEEKINED